LLFCCTPGAIVLGAVLRVAGCLACAAMWLHINPCEHVQALACSHFTAHASSSTAAPSGGLLFFRGRMAACFALLCFAVAYYVPSSPGSYFALASMRVLNVAGKDRLTSFSRCLQASSAHSCRQLLVLLPVCHHHDVCMLARWCLCVTSNACQQVLAEVGCITHG
jgi:hypothetical protein